MGAIQFDPLWTTAFVVVAVCWAVFWLSIFARAARSAMANVPRERTRDAASIAGFVLQGLAYAIAGMAWRPPFTSAAFVGMPFEALLAIVIIALAIASVLLVVSAVRTLGKQWSLTARVLSQHQLVTGGPYQFVRNPIYTGMLGLLVASVLAVGQWWALFPALIVFCLGTAIRVRAEERLLREAFGAQYDDYAQRVPALIPFLI